MLNPGLELRFIHRYVLSLAICAAACYLFFIYNLRYSTEQVIDPAPVTVTLKKGTVLYYNSACNSNVELCKLPKTTKATILASVEANHNLLVATESGFRGFVNKKDFADDEIPQDHPFPGFDDVMGHRYSSSIEGFEGKRLEELEQEFGFATGIVPTENGFLATFRMELYNSSDDQVYWNPSVRFIDSLAVDTVFEHRGREWSWTQYNPLFRIPIWLGYKVTPHQWEASFAQQDTTRRTLDIWFGFDPWWLRAICNVLLGIFYIWLVFFILIRLPILPFYPLVTFAKYSYRLNADMAIGLLFILHVIAYLALVPFIAMNFSTGIWNMIWMLVLFFGGMYAFGKLTGKIEAGKCPTCNHYDSYDLTEHKYSHTTIEQRAETHTSHETRRGRTTSGQSVDVDVEVHHTSYYDVEVKHFNDTYTCRFCGSLKHDTSTEETRLD